MKDFIKLSDERIRKSTIKKYLPFESRKINIYYSTSRYKVGLQTLVFADADARDDAMKELDLQFGLIG